jgi:hypothetical protein
LEIILFKEDWARFPTAVVDYNTSNTSFLRLVKLYKRMGIENCEFPLALLQPELSGVDPYADDLTPELKMKIAMECRYNPWYYFREVARLPPNSGDVPIRFLANRGNIALYWSFFNHVDFALIQPRQTGKSGSTDSLTVGLTYIWASNTTINLITKDTKLKNSNVERLKEIRNLLPDYIHPHNPNDADNSDLLTCIRLGNKYKTAVGRNDKIAADKLGRGMTVPIMQFDEVPYINLIGVSLPVALASAGAARDQAKDQRQPYGNIFTTTPGSILTRDGRWAHQFLTSGAVWSEHYFDLPGEAALHEVVDKGATGLKPLIYGAFNHRQLGKSDEWLLGKLRDSASSGELADRDYFNIWTADSTGSPFDEETRARIAKSELEPLYTQINDYRYVLRWYVSEDQLAMRMANSRTVLALDPSEGLGGDNDAMGMTLYDVETAEILMACRVNETNIEMYANFIADLLVKYPNITFMFERKSTGLSILDSLIIILNTVGIDPFRRIYNRIVDERDEFQDEYRRLQTPVSQRQISFYTPYKRYFGFNTSSSGRHSRDSLYGETMMSAVRYGGHVIRDKELINEFFTLVVKDGRVDHAKGAHDDLVISYLLAHWFVTKGQNLNHYGIAPGSVLTRARHLEENYSPSERRRMARNAEMREVFNNLLDLLKTTKDQMGISRIEMQLRRMSQEIDFGEDSGGVGIDAMIKQATDERTRQMRMSRFGAPAQYGGFRRAA